MDHQRLFADLINSAMDSDWVRAVQREVSARADVILSGDEFHILALDLDNLEEHERRTSVERGVLSALLSRLVRLEYDQRHYIKRVEGECVLAIDAECKSLKEKLPRQDVTDALVATDPAVLRAKADYAQIIEQKKAVEGLLDALVGKSGYIPGAQGQRNAYARQHRYGEGD